MSTGEVLSAATTADQQPTSGAPRQGPAVGLRLQTLAEEAPSAPRQALLPPDLAEVCVASFLRRQGG